jgi:hypothetical protein
MNDNVDFIFLNLFHSELFKKIFLNVILDISLKSQELMVVVCSNISYTYGD